MKAFDFLLFIVIVGFGAFALILGLIGFFNETPFSSAMNAFVVGSFLICGAVAYKKWITNKIKEEESSRGNR